jgi:predicted acetyltransferase
MAIDARAIERGELPDFLRVVRAAFGHAPADDELDDVDRLGWPLERSVAAFDGGDLVGGAGVYPFEMTLPGLVSAPTAGVTWVGVLPTHRRRGVLSTMMRHQLHDVHERGEALAVLLASESIIYGRFGYGMATVQAEYEIAREHTTLVAKAPAPTGRIVLVDEDAARKALPDVHERVRLQQPGDVRRTDGWWANFFRAGKAGGGTAGPRFYALHEDDAGEVDGYAYYRVSQWTPGSVARTAMVQGLGALHLDAYVALWRYVTDIDLTNRTTTTTRPLDEPLRHLLADPRRLKATDVSDYLWCRVVDVPAALALRRYPVADRVVLDVRDASCPWNEGRFVLDGGPDGATCRATTSDTADIALGVADLGAAYLGGTRLASLARAGRVDELTPGAVRRADLLLSGDVEPYCCTHF